jgi:two-component system, NarL family, invasion response regulator UvrY
VTTVRVLLVDDHAVVRAGYRALLLGVPGIEVIGEADSGESAYRQYADHAPDVVVMDLSLPGMGGLEAIRRILARDAEARILVFSMHDDVAFVDQALRAGAQGYITKRSAPEVLADAIAEIARGGVYIDAALEQALAEAPSDENRLSRLSPREFSIFRMLAAGLATGEIAERLCLSTKTVANYATAIKRKLGARNQADLVHLALRHGAAGRPPSAG